MATYFILATGWGYRVLKDQYYMPAYLGGSGDYNRCMEEYPYAKHTTQLKDWSMKIPESRHGRDATGQTDVSDPNKSIEKE